MKLAVAQATLALPISSPNPPVGCCIVSAGGNLIAEGHTQAVGGPHAEVMALRAAQAAGHDLTGATVYVTLEPCSHHGRTPPCADALIAAKVARVVVAQYDPNPLVAGQGLQKLTSAGIQVDVGVLAQEARWVTIGFLSRMIRKRPWVRLKVAAALDGATALANGKSQWITSPQARQDGHTFRARASGILTGIGTVLADDPQLNVRGLEQSRSPIKIVVDSQLRTPPSSRWLHSHDAVASDCWIYTSRDLATCQQHGLRHHTELISLANSDGRVDLHAMMLDLGSRGINELHVEAGAQLNGALLQAGLVDELLLYMAPTLLGSGRPMFHLPALDELSQGASLHWIDVQPIGPDLRIRAVVAGHDQF